MFSSGMGVSVSRGSLSISARSGGWSRSTPSLRSDRHRGFCSPSVLASVSLGVWPSHSAPPSSWFLSQHLLSSGIFLLSSRMAPYTTKSVTMNQSPSSPSSLPVPLLPSPCSHLCLSPSLSLHLPPLSLAFLSQGLM